MDVQAKLWLVLTGIYIVSVTAATTYFVDFWAGIVLGLGGAYFSYNLFSFVRGAEMYLSVWTYARGRHDGMRTLIVALSVFYLACIPVAVGIHGT